MDLFKRFKKEESKELDWFKEAMDYLSDYDNSETKNENKNLADRVYADSIQSDAELNSVINALRKLDERESIRTAINLIVAAVQYLAANRNGGAQ
ncbi:hypothetical protein [Ferrovibrio sp.]|uniref:hypothetical protein n=1 Tax=Ferrovibrio sp. TaxID=1917215 RepID=UPI000CC25E24|nr:hypothetical protein [Ferrovibrio sp.]PJI40398.1 MAG: hypothetical protein CTR53_10330 [Ferrovibrio sp.]